MFVVCVLDLFAMSVCVCVFCSCLYTIVVSVCLLCICCVFVCDACVCFLYRVVYDCVFVVRLLCIWYVFVMRVSAFSVSVLYMIV